MPIKFKPTQITVNRTTGKKSTQNFYMQSTPLAELTSAYEAHSTTSKQKAKIHNELTRRGHKC